jgi:hypothetical protein
MELSNLNPLNLKTKLAGLAVAGLLPLTAQANDWHHSRGVSRVSGEVAVTHQIPGGVITVGAEWGHRPQPQPQVVVVEDRRPDVVVVQDRRPDVVVVHDRRPDVVVIEKGHGHGWRHGHKRHREVTVIRHEAPRKVVVVENRASCNRRDEGYTRSHEWSDGRQVSVDRQGPNGNYHYWSDGNQVSEDRQGPNGNYHYYEDARQVSVQDNRDGRQRNLYVRK